MGLFDPYPEPVDPTPDWRGWLVLGGIVLILLILIALGAVGV